MRFSILTPTRNRRKWIRKCVQSVQNQTHEDWQHVIYDNGDDLVDDLIPEDPRIRYVRGPSLGMAGCWQAALELATGAIVTPLSDDDRLPRRALQVVHDLLEANTDAEWLNGRTALADVHGNPLHLRGGTWDHIHDTRQGQYMLGGAVYWRRGLTEELGGFNSEFDGAGDVDLYMRFLAHSDPIRTKQVLLTHTVHDQQDSIVNRARQADAARRAAERNLNETRAA